MTAGSQTTGSFYAADGTAPLPSYSFTSEPTLGFFRSGAAVVTLQGSLSLTGNINAAGNINAGLANTYSWAGTRSRLMSPADGVINLSILANTIGSQLKVDALPTLVSGGGATTPAAVTAGSTPLAGSINVGTGVITNPIVIAFNGTAFPSAPFAVAINTTTAALLRCTATTTQLTITGAVTFLANDVLSWLCISSK